MNRKGQGSAMGPDRVWFDEAQYIKDLQAKADADPKKFLEDQLGVTWSMPKQEEQK